MLTSDTISNKRLRRKLKAILERTIRITGPEKAISSNDCFNRNAFQTKVALASRLTPVEYFKGRLILLIPLQIMRSFLTSSEQSNGEREKKRLTRVALAPRSMIAVNPS